jgi:hypothetical protein
MPIIESIVFLPGSAFPLMVLASLLVAPVPVFVLVALARIHPRRLLSERGSRRQDSTDHER